MIIELLLSPFYLLISFVIGLLPDVSSSASTSLSTNSGVSSFTSLLSAACVVFPADVFAVIIANVTFWLVVQLGWAIVEWCYRKIPGVN